MAREFGHVAAHLVLSNISDTQYEEIPGVIMPGRSVVFGLDFFLHAYADASSGNRGRLVCARVMWSGETPGRLHGNDSVLVLQDSFDHQELF